MPAPIALFTFRRPHHTRRTLEALQANDMAAESDLFVFSDGPRSLLDEPGVAATREILRTVTGFKSVTLVFHPENIGLAGSVISGVTSVVEKYGRVIVLEDDLVTSPGFLRYMNDGLERYAEDDRVISVHGYLYPLDRSLPETFFLKGADCWGWATWKRGWDLFEQDGVALRNALEAKGLSDRFDFGGAYSYTGMLNGQIARTNDSWAVRWYASALLNDKLTLYPGRSLVINIGNDGEGTNVGRTHSFDVEVVADAICVSEIPIAENLEAYEAFKRYFRHNSGQANVARGKLRDIAHQTVSMAKAAVRGITPPFFLGVTSWLRRKPLEYSFAGDYSGWRLAQASSSGYDAPAILEKVRASVLAVKEGRAVFERDSVLFDRPDYSWVLVSALLRAAAENEGRLSVLDIGGSLGSTYFQCLPMLKGLKHLEWSIVEQPHFVKEGRRTFEDDVLKFYFDSGESLKSRIPTVGLLCSVLAYVPDPYGLIRDVQDRNLEYIVVGSTRVLPGLRDRLTVQTVRPPIYDAAYPAWFFSETHLVAAFSAKYRLIADAGSREEAGVECMNKTFLFKKIRYNQDGL
jgi:putative methyltransferase (TIGR04325 family)